MPLLEHVSGQFTDQSPAKIEWPGPPTILELERAVIEAAITWRANFDHAVADDYTEREVLAQAVDALIAAREKQ